jgi:hypothetical protein
MKTFENPELLRYVRSELRPSRIAVTMIGTVAGCVLMTLFIMMDSNRRQLEPVVFWHNVYSAILLAASIILVLWSLLNTSQGVVSERTHRTFDFWRTTRLSPLALAVGKLVGAPLVPWLLFSTTLPVLLVMGVLGGVSVVNTLISFVVIALFAIALSAVALCASMRAQDARRANLMMLFIVLVVLPSLSMSTRAHGFAHNANAWTALTPVLGIGASLEGEILRVSLFGHAFPSLLLTAILSVVVIAWCLAAMVRGIKFEPEQRSLFSASQVVGVSATVMLFVYAAFRPVSQLVARPGGMDTSTMAQLTLSELLMTGLSAALVCLYFTANSTLLTRDNLRRQMRTGSPVQIVLRLIAPWLATGAVTLLAAMLALKGYNASFSPYAPSWWGVIATYLSVTAYVVRDGLFLQWMISQRVKAPVLKGGVLLGAYYLACSTGSVLLLGPDHMQQALRWLAPPVANPGQAQEPVWLVLATLVPPLATAALIAAGTLEKMRRTQYAAVMVEA